MVKGANSVKAQLASIVISSEGRNRGFPGLRPLPAADSRREIAPALVGPAGPDIASDSAATFALDERADGAGAGNKNGPASASGVGADIGLGRDKTRQKLISLSPSASPDGMFDLIGNHHRGVNLEVDESAFVSNEDGSTAI